MPSSTNTSKKTTNKKSAPKKTAVAKKAPISKKEITKEVETAVEQATAQVSNVEKAAPDAVKEEASVSEVVDEDVETSKSIVEGFNQLIEFHKQQRAIQTAEITRIRAMKTQYERQFKSLHKKANKRKKKKNVDSENNGFKRPTKISDELCDFFGRPHGTLMARTDVTKELSNYIRENKLQDPKNGRNILPDQKLRKLLRIGKTDELNIFNMQTYMVPHYPKTNTQKVASVVSEASA